MIRLEIDEIERKLLLAAIHGEKFLEFINTPATPRMVRDAYKSIKVKLKETKNSILIVP